MRPHSRHQVPEHTMEPLWSPVVATVGNRRQIDRTSKSRKQAKSVASGCHRLRPAVHGCSRFSDLPAARGTQFEGGSMREESGALWGRFGSLVGGGLTSLVAWKGVE